MEDIVQARLNVTTALKQAKILCGERDIAPDEINLIALAGLILEETRRLKALERLRKTEQQTGKVTEKTEESVTTEKPPPSCIPDDHYEVAEKASASIIKTAKNKVTNPDSEG